MSKYGIPTRQGNRLPDQPVIHAPFAIRTASYPELRLYQEIFQGLNAAQALLSVLIFRMVENEGVGA